MKNIFRILAVVALVTVMSVPAKAGNDDRRGTAGAPELLINPWARSAGWGSVNTACARGLDAFFTNVAGLGFIKDFEFGYTNTMYLGGKSGLESGATINAFGLGKSLFEQRGVLAVYVMAMSFGDLPTTTVNSPEPGSNGTFSPTLMNLNVAYAHNFTGSIHGGVNFKVIAESIDNVSASGFGIDAGIQYVTGANDELKFGISLKNIGSTLSFGGTGLSFQVNNAQGNTQTVEYRSAEMELPTLLNIGASYDFLFDKWDQRFTIAGNFTSNSFLKDNFAVGGEYSLLNRVMLRAAYVYQTDIFNATKRTTFNTGLSCGASVVVPINKESGSEIIIDYSYRSAASLRGTHSVGATINL